MTSPDAVVSAGKPDEPRKTDDQKKMGRVRWTILAWLLFAGILNYMDRSSVSIAAPHMIEELGLNKTDIGLMGTVFSWTYAVCQLPAGWIIDKFGPRRVFAIAVGAWSIATSLMAAGHNMLHFLSFRFLLGIGESPNSPNCSKITTEWFPRSERGFATGIWDSGSKWGSAIAPPVLTALSLTFGWRAMFLIVGLVGLVLALCFWVFYRSPENDKRLSDEEYRHILTGRDSATDDDHPEVVIPWLSFFAHRQTWGMMLGFFSSIWIWNIFITFLPLFLQDTLGVSIASTGWVAAIPYIAGAIGGIFGGRVTMVLAQSGRKSPLQSKKQVLMVACVLVGVLLLVVPNVHNLVGAIIVLCFALALVAAIQSQSWALTSDVVPDTHAARFGGIMNFGGYFGGALAPVVTGFIADQTGSYTLAFYIAAVIAMLGAAFYGFLVKKPLVAIEEKA
ncbi:MFS transporter [Propionimicrobium sp. PCR01-08-3]|uniref:MFS transporter n=1 Tax=Propionimicrobium sp. PCR01-08-3 TaxID=3052086 RepID=UPI00255C9DF8|nr:MFS transporter [Propionimicrobium sp. PCR01-08-3]WIY83667.1 MFS transporter [Propionimicrobium sp. PCR01-08-3]